MSLKEKVISKTSILYTLAPKCSHVLIPDVEDGV